MKVGMSPEAEISVEFLHHITIWKWIVDSRSDKYLVFVWSYRLLIWNV